MRDCPEVGVDALSEHLSIDLETMSWSAGSVKPAEAVNIPAGADPVSLMLSSYLPTLVDGANEKVAAAQAKDHELSLIHISEPTRRLRGSRMPSSA